MILHSWNVANDIFLPHLFWKAGAQAGVMQCIYNITAEGSRALGEPHRLSTHMIMLWCPMKTKYKKNHSHTCFTLSDKYTYLTVRAFTFGLTLLEGNSTTALGDQVPSTREAGGAADLGLVRPQGTGQAGDEAVMRVLTWRALTWSHTHTHTQIFGEVRLWTVRHS